MNAEEQTNIMITCSFVLAISFMVIVSLLCTKERYNKCINSCSCIFTRFGGSSLSATLISDNNVQRNDENDTA